MYPLNCSDQNNTNVAVNVCHLVKLCVACNPIPAQFIWHETRTVPRSSSTAETISKQAVVDHSQISNTNVVDNIH